MANDKEKPREPGPGGMFRRVLVGFDGSAEAQRALRVALALATDLQGEAHVLLVVRPPAHAETPEEHGFDLVVVGDHGREQTTHRGIGQSVQALLRNHPCPVLVV